MAKDPPDAPDPDLWVWVGVTRALPRIAIVKSSVRLASRSVDAISSAILCGPIAKSAVALVD